jgi:threonine dehydrogenase-like Zn-dependent dehydrogenase
MKAVVFHNVGKISLDDVPEPRIKEPTDAIVRLTASAICGTDLHMIRGTMADMKPGTILGHEGVGIIEELGKDVRNFNIGDRVIIPSTIACGYCAYCRSGYYAQCDNANPNGPQAGTAFFGGPRSTGPFDGLQAEKARIPFASAMLIKVPDEMTDEQAILLSDIFPTGYMGAELAEIKDGDTVAVFGCGPVGLLTILSAQILGAGRVFAVDRVASRLDKARQIGAETVNFEEEDPVKTLRRLTGDIGPDRVIDAVGVDADHADHGPARPRGNGQAKRFEEEVQEVAPKQNPDDDLWVPGDAPSQVLQWAVEAVAKAGTISIIGVYPPTMQHFPIGQAMNKNLTIKLGNCNHRKYIPRLVRMVAGGEVDPTVILTQDKPLTSAIEAFEHFDRRERGWVKVELEPSR